MVFVIPVIMLTIALFKPTVVILAIALGSMYIGLLAERWYFFAEGNHPQNIYYQSIAWTIGYSIIVKIKNTVIEVFNWRVFFKQI